MANSLTILAIADLHYSPRHPGEQAYRLAIEWARRAIISACRDHAPDVLVLLGDLVDDGGAPGANRDMARLAAELSGFGLPIIVAPGNHDKNPKLILQAFGDQPGVHRIKGCTIYSFADPYDADETCTRPGADIEKFLSQRMEGPVIAVQHSPIFPDVPDTSFPYMPKNAAEIMASYEKKGVVASISGHYHPGQPAARRNGTTYITSGALCRSPFPYYIIQIRGQEVVTVRGQLSYAPETSLIDGHIHTHFGYCAVDVHPIPAVERAKLLGLKGVCCVEHAGQLYLSAEEFWNRTHIEDPKAMEKSRKRGEDRVGAFRTAMGEFRDNYLSVGLELECDADGKLTLLEEDKEGWDVLLGAVHWLPSRLPAKTQVLCAQAFMKVVEQMLNGGIGVLAHPFRIFQQSKLSPPIALYRPLARLLREKNVAAEINFHNFRPDPEFYRICLEEGVRLALGSDAHSLYEVADLSQHLALLREIGAAGRDTGGER